MSRIIDNLKEYIENNINDYTQRAILNYEIDKAISNKNFNISISTVDSEKLNYIVDRLNEYLRHKKNGMKGGCKKEERRNLNLSQRSKKNGVTTPPNNPLEKAPNNPLTVRENQGNVSPKNPLRNAPKNPLMKRVLTPFRAHARIKYIKYNKLNKNNKLNKFNNNLNIFNLLYSLTKLLNNNNNNNNLFNLFNNSLTKINNNNNIYNNTSIQNPVSECANKSNVKLFPCLDDIEKVCLEKNYHFSPSQFYEYYQSRNWRDKYGNLVSDYKYQMECWEKRQVVSTQQPQAQAQPQQSQSQMYTPKNVGMKAPAGSAHDRPFTNKNYKIIDLSIGA